jgi:hypothetical protein
MSTFVPVRVGESGVHRKAEPLTGEGVSQRGWRAAISGDHGIRVGRGAFRTHFCLKGARSVDFAAAVMSNQARIAEA